MEDKQGYAEQVRAVKSFLLTHGWIKGTYFRAESEKVCACAHGAAQVVSNPCVSRILADSYHAPGPAAARATAVAAHACAAEAADLARVAGVPAAGVLAARDAERAIDACAHTTTGALLSCWANRGDWIRESHDYGNLDLHYLLGLFGITATYNDAKDTTLGKLVAKLDECAAWAELHEDILTTT